MVVWYFWCYMFRHDVSHVVMITIWYEPGAFNFFLNAHRHIMFSRLLILLFFPKCWIHSGRMSITRLIESSSYFALNGLKGKRKRLEFTDKVICKISYPEREPMGTTVTLGSSSPDGGGGEGVTNNFASRTYSGMKLAAPSFPSSSSSSSSSPSGGYRAMIL